MSTKFVTFTSTYREGFCWSIKSNAPNKIPTFQTMSSALALKLVSA